MKEESSQKMLRKVLFFYALFYSILFLQLPLKNSIPGNTDTLMAIALSNLCWEKLCLFLHGASTITTMYPAKDVMAYGENCYGLAIIFLLFKLITSSDIWGYYFFIVSIFSLNSFALYKLAQLFVRDSSVAVLAGFVFSLSGFYLANIDDPNVIFVFLPITALYFLELGLRKKEKNHIFLGVFLSGLQIWFGFYVFMIQFMALALFFMVHGRGLLKDLTAKEACRLTLAYLAPAIPLLSLYVYNYHFAEVFSPYSNDMTVAHSSLSWHNFLNVAPNNLIYSSAKNIYGNLDIGSWHRLRKTAFPGFVLPIFGLLGIIKGLRKNYYYLVLFIISFALSFGVNFPIFILLMKLPLGSYFRVACRFYLFALIPGTIFFSMGFQYFIQKMKSFAPNAIGPIFVVAAVIYYAENVPTPLLAYDFGNSIKPPQAELEFFKNFSKPQIILDLPSTCFYQPRANEHDQIWFYNREILYMNWQTYHRQLIIGGVNSYVPRSRATLDAEFQQIPEEKSLKRIKMYGTKYIVFHKKLILLPAEDSLAKLKQSSALRLAVEDSEIAAFEIL